MFDIGFAELVVLAVIAMVVVGPERLPGVLRTVGKTVGQARRFMTGLQNQIEQEVKLDELNKKIMAETKDMDFTQTKPAEPSHDTEDAEQPSIAPKNNMAEELTEADMAELEASAQRPGFGAASDESSEADAGANSEEKSDDVKRS